MNDLWKKIKIKYNKYKTRMLVLLVSLIPSMPLQQPILQKNKKIHSEKISQKADIADDTMEEAFIKGKCKDIMSFVKKSPHIDDTIVVNYKNVNVRLCAGVYLQKDDKVHLKYFVPDLNGADSATAQKIIRYTKAWNDEIYRMSNKAHEHKHRHTHKSGTFKTGVCMEDNARLSQHNEIASYITNLLYEREVYLAMQKRGIYTKKYLDDLFSPRFRQYSDAVKKGIIVPGSDNPHMQEAENFLIVKTVSEWWIGKEQQINSGVTIKRLNWFVKNYPSHIHKRRDIKEMQAYVKALDKCYTFIKDGKLVNMNYFQRGLFDSRNMMSPKQLWKNFTHTELMPPYKLDDVELTDAVKKKISQLRQEDIKTLKVLKKKQQQAR